MTWKRVHRRHRVVRAVVDRAADGPAAPTAAEREAIDAEFADFDDFLLDVHSLWTRAFDTRLDTALEVPPADLRRAVADAWSGLATALPGARRILDEYADRPELVRAMARADQRLLAATGVDRREVATARPRQPQTVSACARRRLQAVRVALSHAG